MPVAARTPFSPCSLDTAFFKFLNLAKSTLVQSRCGCFFFVAMMTKKWLRRLHQASLLSPFEASWIRDSLDNNRHSGPAMRKSTKELQHPFPKPAFQKHVAPEKHVERC